MKFEIRNRIVCLALAILVAAPPLLRGQRLPGRIDGRAKTLLRGSRNSRVDGLESLGPVDAGMRVQGMTFRFRPTPAQSAELDQLLEDQQNPTSPQYHAWLTPEEYGERFGLSPEDFRNVASWL